MDGRGYVIPEDVKKEAVPVLAHRLAAVSRSHMDPVKFIAGLLDELAVPLE